MASLSSWSFTLQHWSLSEWMHWSHLFNRQADEEMRWVLATNPCTSIPTPKFCQGFSGHRMVAPPQTFWNTVQCIHHLLRGGALRGSCHTLDDAICVQLSCGLSTSRAPSKNEQHEEY